MARLPVHLTALACVLTSVLADYQCLFHQHLTPGRAYTVTSPGFPARYQSGESCQWVARASDDDSRIVLDCDLFDLPPPNKNGRCTDALWISSSGRRVVLDGEGHCGAGQFTLVTTGPRLNMELRTERGSPGGAFRCSVAATQPGPKPPVGPPGPKPTVKPPVGPSVGPPVGLPVGPPVGPPPVGPPVRPPPSTQYPNKPSWSLPPKPTPPQQPYPTKPPATARPPTGNCTCAVRGKPQETRVVGGVETSPSEYPMAAYLEDDKLGRLLCGAALLSERFALTAAHCAKLAVNTGGGINLIVGDHDRSEPNWKSRRQELRVHEFVVHPDFTGSWLRGDIAVVRLATAAKLGPSVQPACLPFSLSKFNLAGQSVTVLGWGAQRINGPTSLRLNAARLEVIKKSQCAASYGKELGPGISDAHICAFRKNASPCTGDSGGPVVWQSPRTGALMLVGLVSHGESCPGDKPVINTRVTSYLRWVQEVTREPYCYID